MVIAFINMENIKSQESSEDVLSLNYQETEALMFKMREDGTWLDSEGKPHSLKYKQLIAHIAKLESDIMDKGLKS